MTPKLLKHRVWQQNLGVLWWCLRKVPMLFWMSPRLLELDETRCRLRVPLNWRTKNHVGSMYFGALLSAADLVCGLLALAVAEAKGHRCRLLFREVHGRFLKRPESDVEFQCQVSEDLTQQIEQMEIPGDKAFSKLLIQAICQDEVVAEFELEVAMKKM